MRFTMRLSDTIADGVAKKAAALGVSQTDVIRLAVVQFLEEDGVKLTPPNDK